MAMLAFGATVMAWSSGAGAQGTTTRSSAGDPGAASAFTPVSPQRICDTRPDQPTNQCTGKRLATGGTLTVAMPPPPVVPSDATAAVVNITVTNSAGQGYLEVYPAGSPSPTQLTSVVNFTSGQTVANSITARLGANNAITIENGPPGGTGGPVDVVVDLQGYYAAPAANSVAGQYHPQSPARIADTRCATTSSYCTGLPPANRGLTTLGPNASEDLQVTGVDGVPSSNVSAVVLNVGVTNTTGSSYLTAWPAGTKMPTVSNQNWVPGETLSAKVIAPVGSGGKISLYNYAGATDAVVDVAGYYSTAGGTAGDLFTPMTPVRVIGTNASPQAVQPGQSATAMIAGANGVPPGAAAGALNVTDVQPTRGNFLTAYPNGESPPTAADVNWVPGNTYNVVPNASYAKVGTDGKIAVYNGPPNTANNAGTTGVIADLFGYFTPAA